MTLKTIDPMAAKRLLDEGAVLVDIREADEHAREKIAGARHFPISGLADSKPLESGSRPVIFHCKSGARTLANAPRLAEKIGDTCVEAYVVDGGLDAWKKAGLPVLADRRQPLELQRQVQIGAGSMGLAGTLLGLSVSPWFFAIPAFVGAGLIFAGVTGICGMANLLMRAPWNKAVYGQTRSA
ncbi:MAG: hypothetical protein JWL93_1356 [Hyphomicrobiales bacterium]|nr:hypothetical protein [Hyphomicrobiales bacterium]